MYVISRNYFDRHSDDKWLVREYGKPHETGMPVKVLSASEVRFIPSDKYERLHGCGVVAVADSVQFEKLPRSPLAHELRFSIFLDGFVDTETFSPVDKVKSLTLTAHGKMLRAHHLRS